VALFEGQRILIVSPQPWEHLQLSKHHYAIELARRGNEVIFLDPPDATLSGISIARADRYDGIKVIRYRQSAPLFLRFHSRRLFDFIQRSQVEEILGRVGGIDVVWCFDFNTFSDLGVFKAPTKIFHPVDPVSDPRHVQIARSADVVFSVSDRILASFSKTGVPQYLIDHGLGSEFAEQARHTKSRATDRPGRPRVGYAGNLARPPLNRTVIERMVAENADAEFHFWGPHTVLPGASLSFTEEVRSFVEFLQASPNATLHGHVSSEKMSVAMQEMDCFILSYTLNATESDRSNSHKILEYLSTGKVVVSSRIDRYVEHRELIRMAPSDDDSVLPAILADTLSQLGEWNASELQKRRRELALDNTYEKQTDRIRDRILGLSGAGR
jgi:glycosyltransferase involved in cell wall biosynthesis